MMLLIDVHDYNMNNSERVNFNAPRYTKALFKRSFLYQENMLWHDLLSVVKESHLFDQLKSQLFFIA